MSHTEALFVIVIVIGLGIFFLRSYLQDRGIYYLNINLWQRKRKLLAFEQGRKAFPSDSLFACPYSRSSLANRWKEGWLAAKVDQEQLEREEYVHTSRVSVSDQNKATVNPPRHEQTQTPKTEPVVIIEELNVDEMHARLQSVLGQAGSLGHYGTDPENQARKERLPDYARNLATSVSTWARVRPFAYHLTSEALIIIDMLRLAIECRESVPNFSLNQAKEMEHTLDHIEPAVKESIESLGYRKSEK